MKEKKLHNRILITVNDIMTAEEKMKEKKLIEEEVLQNRELIMKMVDSFEEPRKTKVKELLDGKLGEMYFTAPASSRVEYHACYPGGLAEHSISVAKNLVKIVNTLYKDKYSKETLYFVSIFHDFGKIGDGIEEFYIPNDSEWHRKQGKLYNTNEKCVYLPTSERGLYILQNYGISMTADEYIAIRLNDGQYAPENKPYAMKEPKLALLLHWADRWSSEMEKDSLLNE